MKKRILTLTILSSVLLSFNISCSDDFVETEFKQDLAQAPLQSVDEVQSFVRGIYSSMRDATYYGCDYLAYGEVRSDEMFSNTGSGYFLNVQNYSMLSNDAYATDTWNKIYETVAKSNIVVNTDVSSFSTGEAQANYLKGQAYGLRAVAFFDLLKLYGQQFSGTGDLGIVIPTVYDPKAKMARASVSETENQIDADFTKAIQMMEANGGYDDPSNKTDLSINALKSLMTRFYLYKKDYSKVRSLVSDIVSSGNYEVASATSVPTFFSFNFNGSAPNSIFELAVGINSALATDSYNYVLGLNGYANIQLQPGVEDIYSEGDVRAQLLTEDSGDYFVTGKYTQQNGADNVKMIRYEEVLLAGVEAELNGGSSAKALEYYNEIITNRGLEAVSVVNMDILKLERMKELLGEGQRQWDLLRWGDKSFKPAEVEDALLAFPIPRAETNIANTPIVSNPGYDN